MTDPFFRPLNLRPQQQQQARAARFSGASMLCDVTDKVDKFEVVAGRYGSDQSLISLFVTSGQRPTHPVTHNKYAWSCTLVCSCTPQPPRPAVRCCFCSSTPHPGASYITN